MDWQTGNGVVKLYQSEFEVAWLGELGIQPMTIVEIGSYDGGDALRLNAAFPNARVVTVEADPDRFKVVQANCRHTQIDVLQAAVLDRDGPIEWYQATVDGKIDSQGSLYRHTDRLNRKFPQVRQSALPIVVAGRRLDSLCAELGILEIDFLHTDIQGAEFAALSGLGNMRPRAIFLEVESGGWVGAGSADDIADLLHERGYRLAADLGGDRLYVA